jgi:hypothetical protein
LPCTDHGKPYIHRFDLLEPAPSSSSSLPHTAVADVARPAAAAFASGYAADGGKTRPAPPPLGCVVGCNGYAAKSSDEIGRLAARMMLAELLVPQQQQQQQLKQQEGMGIGGGGSTEGVDMQWWGDGLDTGLFRAVSAAEESSS